jgi:hypothetical protein
MMNTFLSNLFREKDCVPPVVVVDNARIRFISSNNRNSHDPTNRRVRVRQRNEGDTDGYFHFSDERWSDSTPKEVDFEPMLPARCLDRSPVNTMTTRTTREISKHEHCKSDTDDSPTESTVSSGDLYRYGITDVEGPTKIYQLMVSYGSPTRITRKRQNPQHRAL